MKSLTRKRKANNKNKRINWTRLNELSYSGMYDYLEGLGFQKHEADEVIKGQKVRDQLALRDVGGAESIVTALNNFT